MQVDDARLITQLADAIREGTRAPSSWISYIPVVSALIACVSAVTTVLLYFKNQKNARAMEETRYVRSIMPTLFFIPGDESTFSLENVSGQPAANIEIEQYKVLRDSNDRFAASAIIFSKGGHVLVEGPTRYQMAENTKISVTLSKEARLLVARYSDLYDENAYATVFDIKYGRNVFKFLTKKQPGKPVPPTINRA